MSIAPAAGTIGAAISAFDERDAAAIVRWAETDADVRLVAPGTAPPLTVEKILAWQRPGGRAYVLRDEDLRAASQPLAYAELNPMPSEPHHLWLGHCIVRPDLRGRGLGLRFVRELLSTAFGRLGCRKVSLIVFPDNEPAVRCYRRAGFLALGEEWHVFADDVRSTLLRMEAYPNRSLNGGQ